MKLSYHVQLKEQPRTINHRFFFHFHHFIWISKYFIKKISYPHSTTLDTVDGKNGTRIKRKQERNTSMWNTLSSLFRVDNMLLTHPFSLAFIINLNILVVGSNLWVPHSHTKRIFPSIEKDPYMLILDKRLKSFLIFRFHFIFLWKWYVFHCLWKILAVLWTFFFYIFLTVSIFL